MRPKKDDKDDENVSAANKETRRKEFFFVFNLDSMDLIFILNIFSINNFFLLFFIFRIIFNRTHLQLRQGLNSTSHWFLSHF